MYFKEVIQRIFFFLTFGGLDGPGWLYLVGLKAIPRLRARLSDFERPQHASRSPAGTHTCNVVYRRASLRAPQSRVPEKTRGRRRKACKCPKKVHLVRTMVEIVIYNPRDTTQPRLPGTKWGSEDETRSYALLCCGRPGTTVSGIHEYRPFVEGPSWVKSKQAYC